MREAYPNELMHYGILGMKWGVRRFQNPDGTLTDAGKRRYGTRENFDKGITAKEQRSIDERRARYVQSDGTLNEPGKKIYGTIENLEKGLPKEKADKINNKNTKADRLSANKNRRILTDSDLSSRISRIQTEKTLKSLTAEDLYPGKKAVEDALSSAAIKFLTTAALGGLSYYVNYSLNKKADKTLKPDWKKAAEYIAPNPNKKK